MLKNCFLSSKDKIGVGGAGKREENGKSKSQRRRRKGAFFYKGFE